MRTRQNSICLLSIFFFNHTRTCVTFQWNENVKNSFSDVFAYVYGYSLRHTFHWFDERVFQSVFTKYSQKNFENLMNCCFKKRRTWFQHLHYTRKSIGSSSLLNIITIFVFKSRIMSFNFSEKFIIPSPLIERWLFSLICILLNPFSCLMFVLVYCTMFSQWNTNLTNRAAAVTTTTKKPCSR